jgi:hypothetical protein
MSTNTTTKLQFIKRLQARVAMLAIPASALRNQGAPGVVDAARCFLTALDLRTLAVKSSAQFRERLNDNTKKLRLRFPTGAQSSWGGARKAINLFLRDVVYSEPLCEFYDLSHIGPWLELPLDKEAHRGLKADFPKVASWSGVKDLRWRSNAKMQGIATLIAKGRQIRRIDLDVIYWRKAAIDKLM